jgi:hypothetical protein
MLFLRAGGYAVTLKNRLIFLLLFLTAIESALAQGRSGAVTIRTTMLSPIIALLAGIVILLMPRVLNFVVAIYLILIGLIGLFGV